MPGQDFIVAPDVAPITVALEPAQNAFTSLLLLTKVEHLSGLSDWVVSTANSFTPRERQRHMLVIIGFYYAILPEQSWPSFPAYVDHLATLDPNELRDRLFAAYAKAPPLTEGKKAWYKEPRAIDLGAILKNVDSYVNFLRERFDPKKLDTELEAQAYSYVIDPPAMQDLVVSHLRKMWDEHLAFEWERARPMLHDSVEAFQQIDFSDMSRLEAVRLVTGQETEKGKWGYECELFERAERVIFIPSAHIGPYRLMLLAGDTIMMLFGARLPKGVHFHAPDLNRAEIVVRLSALADDSRLRILRLISEKGELSSHDVMAALGLSQSATSRHLKQLSATAYVSERRCNGAKCYKLNPERIEDTLRAVSIFLLVK
jgi:DNA-binding transcriptional ArsR family regulator